jgi:hypothetical protein
MRFECITVPSDIDPTKIRCTYYKSHNDNYRIQKSLTSDLWLAFYRVDAKKNNFSLVGPATQTYKGAIGLCEEHSASLPW